MLPIGISGFELSKAISNESLVLESVTSAFVNPQYPTIL